MAPPVPQDQSINYKVDNKSNTIRSELNKTTAESSLGFDDDLLYQMRRRSCAGPGSQAEGGERYGLKFVF